MLKSVRGLAVAVLFSLSVAGCIRCAPTGTPSDPKTCGKINAVCCSSGTPCQSGAECKSTNSEQAWCMPLCGYEGNLCCSDGATPPKHTCNPGLACGLSPDPYCYDCGDAGQMCCSGNSCNDGLTCGAGSIEAIHAGNPPLHYPTCQTFISCGNKGQECCTHDKTVCPTCPTSLCAKGLTCDSGKCSSPGTGSGGSGGTAGAGGSAGSAGTPTGGAGGSQCGQANQPCCNNVSCSLGTECKGGFCQLCGAQGQACCANSSCGANLECKGGFCSACGISGTPCCAGNSCDASSHCSGGYCVKSE
jgi:hypothetical protein